MTKKSTWSNHFNPWLSFLVFILLAVSLIMLGGALKPNVGEALGCFQKQGVLEMHRTHDKG